MQPASMTPQKRADNLTVEPCMLTDVYDESIINDVFIEKVDASIRHSHHNYGATSLHAI